MNRLILLLSLIVLAFSVSAQKREYDYGKIAELKGLTKFYVNANAGDREAIVKLLDGQSGLSLVDSSDDADFLIAFEQFPSRQLGAGHIASGQFDAYIRQGERLRAVWVKEDTDGAFKQAVAKKLAKKFLKEYAKVQ